MTEQHKQGAGEEQRMVQEQAGHMRRSKMHPNRLLLGDPLHLPYNKKRPAEMSVGLYSSIRAACTLSLEPG